MFRNFLKKIRPKKKFLGIDIGTFFVKIVEIKEGIRKPVLTNYGELGILGPEKRAFRIFEKETLLLSDYDLAKAIRTICDEAKIQTKEANFCIPDFSSFFTTIKLPLISKEEIPEAIKYEIRPYIPLPLSEITLDWVITEGQVAKTPLKILVVAIPNNIIEQYKEIAKISRLTLKIIEPEAFALARALKFMFRTQNAKKVVALIDIGARSTTCNILEEEVLKISNSFNIGSSLLIEALARFLNISYNKAEELQISQGLVLERDSAKTSNPDISRVLLPLVNEMINEIKKSFINFSQTEGKEVEKIILAGGMALLPGLKEYFSKEFNKEVLIGNPFMNIYYNPILKEVLEKRGPSYAIAVGLAMKGIE
jgi:type IV pilus assembly protein PilM